jgi:hypothetical protein
MNFKNYYKCSIKEKCSGNPGIKYFNRNRKVTIENINLFKKNVEVGNNICNKCYDYFLNKRKFQPEFEIKILNNLKIIF